MSFTPVYSIPYQTLADPPDGPNLGEDGFMAVDAALAAIAAQVSPLAKGLVGFGSRPTSSTATATEVGVLRVDDIPVMLGRSYLIKVTPAHCQGNAGVVVAARFRITTDGSDAGTGSTEVRYVQTTILTGTPDQPINIEHVYKPASDHLLSVLLTVGKIAGAGNVTLIGGGTKTIDLCIYDTGLAVADTGVDI